jgi:hypothetical protein
MNKTIVSRFKVMGSSKDWEVCLYDDGTLSCNCAAWIFHKGERVNCKHCDEIQNNLNSKEVVIQGTK